jgi:uncharacterized protein YqeY
MSLREQLENDLKQALRSGERTRLGSIRLMLSTVHNAEIEKGHPLSDDETVAVLQKQAKRHRESITEFTKGNREDLVAKEVAELAVVESYLPRQMSREEVVELAQRIIAEVNAQGPRDMNRVMPRLMAEIRGRADGRVASQVVQELLAGR